MRAFSFVRQAFDAKAVNETLRSLISSGHKNDALKLLQNIELQARTAVDVAVFNTLLSSYSRLNDNERFKSALESMNARKISPSAVTYNIIINYYRHAPDGLKLAEKVFSHMIDQGIQPTVITYGTMINIYFENGKPEHAFALFEQMLQKKMEINSTLFTMVIKECLRGKDIKNARKLFNQMMQLNAYSSESLFNILISELINNGMAKIAIEMYEKQRMNSRPFDDIGFASLIKSLAANRLFQDVDQVMELIKRNGIAVSPVWCLAILEGKSKCGYSIQELYDDYKESGKPIDSYILFFFTHNFLASRKIEECTAMIAEYLAAGNQLDIRVVNHLLKYYRESEDFAQMRHWFDKGINEFKIAPTIETFLEFLKYYQMAENVDQMFKCYLEMKKRDIDSNQKVFDILYKFMDRLTAEQREFVVNDLTITIAVSGHVRQALLKKFKSLDNDIY